jgi:DNA repair photolyase
MGYAGRFVDGPVRGRGAGLNPPNRFERLSLEVLGEHWDHLATETRRFEDGRQVATQVLRDYSRTVLNPVDSPDLPFAWTLNPYRGCEHGCVYCYARPTHETLALGCGLDFETRILAKPDAARLLRAELGRESWKGQAIVMSGVTDPYQPIESKLGITRGCLEVMVEHRQAVAIVTKSRLVLRDLDLLGELNRHQAAHVAVSLTTLDNALASKMEPRAASPSDRLWTIRRLAAAGIPVMVMTAPIIPAINDRELPALLKAAADAGATSAGYVLLRLPHQNKALFEEWLDRHFPDRKKHVLNILRQTRGGELYDPAWNTRMTGQGAFADQIQQTFTLFARRFGLHQRRHELNTDAFRRPADAAQFQLFESPGREESVVDIPQADPIMQPRI